MYSRKGFSAIYFSLPLLYGEEDIRGFGSFGDDLIKAEELLLGVICPELLVLTLPKFSS